METQWEPVNQDLTYVKASELKPGDAIEGLYTEKKIDEKYHVQKYFIKGTDQKVKVVNGSAQLDSAMKDILPGTVVKIVFEGKKQIEKGPRKGSQMNNWKVFRAKSGPVSVEQVMMAAKSVADEKPSPRAPEPTQQEIQDAIPF